MSSVNAIMAIPSSAQLARPALPSYPPAGAHVLTALSASRRSRRLQRGQGRRQRADPEHGAGAGAPRHPRQRRGPGLRPHRRAGFRGQRPRRHAAVRDSAPRTVAGTRCCRLRAVSSTPGPRDPLRVCTGCCRARLWAAWASPRRLPTSRPSWRHKSPPISQVGCRRAGEREALKEACPGVESCPVRAACTWLCRPNHLRRRWALGAQLHVLRSCAAARWMPCTLPLPPVPA